LEAIKLALELGVCAQPLGLGGGGKTDGDPGLVEKLALTGGSESLEALNGLAERVAALV